MTQTLFGEDVKVIGDVLKTVETVMRREKITGFAQIAQACIEEWGFTPPYSDFQLYQILNVCPSIDRAIRKVKDKDYDPYNSY